VYRTIRPSPRARIDSSTGRTMTALGVLLYAVVPALIFLGLNLIEAVSFNFIFQAGIPLVLAFTAGAILHEPTSKWEFVGVATVVAGIYVFFPVAPKGSEAAGLLLAAGAATGIGVSNLLQRQLMRSGVVRSIDATLIPMAVGSLALLAVALVVESFPALGAKSIALLLMLGVVNTAFAFTLWHKAMKTLKALHAGVIATSQLVEVAVLAWLFLDEDLTSNRIIGSAVVIVGIVVVHVSKARAAKDTLDVPLVIEA
jgi:drug/metabolite transporter (DMT)-like permease